MADKMTFDDFLGGLSPSALDFVAPMHKYLSDKGFWAEVKPAAQGPVVSYKTPDKKKTVFNYVFRKSGMQVRIYGDNAHSYQEFLRTLPAEMQLMMENAGVCKPCNSRCPKGYPVGGEQPIKCRYAAFLFPLTEESEPFIAEFIKTEVQERERNFARK